MRPAIAAINAVAAFAFATPGLAEVPAVVTDIPPVHALVAQVIGDLGAPVLLLGKGADEHDFQLRPSQAGVVAEADLVVWIGPELTPWLDTALANRPEGAATLALLTAPGTETQSFAADVSAGIDPHAWLDPDNARHWLGLIAADLARIDPANAATYAANAATASAAIDDLDAGIVERLAAVKDRPLLTHHDAFGYFAAHYGLTIVGSIASGDASAPGAARLADLRARLEAGDVVCLFPESQHDPALAEQIAEGTGVRIGGALDPVGASLEPGAAAYGDLLAGIADTIAGCAGG